MFVASLFATTLCEPFCDELCADLNGDIVHECGDCKEEMFACRPGEPGFPALPPSFDKDMNSRVADRPGFDSSPGAPTFDVGMESLAGLINNHEHSMRMEIAPSEVKSELLMRNFFSDSYNQQFGCQPHEFDSATCAASGETGAMDAGVWKPLSKLQDRQTFCSRAFCASLRAFDRRRATILARAPALYLIERGNALRIAAAELVGFMCTVLASTHPVEGPTCVRLGASLFDAYSIALRWAGLDIMRRMVDEPLLRADRCARSDGSLLCRFPRVMVMSQAVAIISPLDRCVIVGWLVKVSCSVPRAT